MTATSVTDETLSFFACAATCLRKGESLVLSDLLLQCHFFSTVRSALQVDSCAVGRSLLCMANSVPSLSERNSRRCWIILRNVTSILAHISGLQVRCGWTLVWCSSFSWPCIWLNLGKAIKPCFLWHWHGHADFVLALSWVLSKKLERVAEQS